LMGLELARTVIFIDGQNLHKRLEELGLAEKDIRWDLVFSDLVPPGEVLIWVYWYQAGRVAPWEWQPGFRHRCPPGLTPSDFKAMAEAYYKSEKERPELLQRNVYSRLEEDFAKVEFRYSGVLKVDPMGSFVDKSGNLKVGKRIGEKGVDVALAIDLFKFAEFYDHAVLLSGDYDYVPAIQAVKDRLKKITAVPIMHGTPPASRGHACRLKGLCDQESPLYESDLKGRFKR